MEKGNSPCVERISCVREMGLSVWREGDGGARCVDRGLELGVLRSVCGSKLGELCVCRVRVREQNGKCLK